MEGYRRCNNYGKEGHFGKDCPTLARTTARPPVQASHQHQRRDRGNRPQAMGQVYAMTGAEATGSGNLCELVISTLASGLVRTSSLCARCPVEVEGRRYKVNLICLPLQELEVIIGMDWLSTNRILIDCREKRLLFPDSEELELVSPQRVVREIQSGVQCFIIFARMEVGERETISYTYGT
ncbi:uncharacterized protein LOC114163577 [Vigna unguiculata]|uniref:uncharacterized protein LOC114163577 n=1 Tax=Vigna unguiculata TaxID=3917 RepID=UPI0010169D24|nr:uncharacterized protein LOC114163577 [Vigna unguiculata]